MRLLAKNLSAISSQGLLEIVEPPDIFFFDKFLCTIAKLIFFSLFCLRSCKPTSLELWAQDKCKFLWGQESYEQSENRRIQVGKLNKNTVSLWRKQLQPTENQKRLSLAVNIDLSFRNRRPRTRKLSRGNKSKEHEFIWFKKQRIEYFVVSL